MVWFDMISLALQRSSRPSSLPTTLVPWTGTILECSGGPDADMASWWLLSSWRLLATGSTRGSVARYKVSKLLEVVLEQQAWYLFRETVLLLADLISCDCRLHGGADPESDLVRPGRRLGGIFEKELNEHKVQ